MGCRREKLPIRSAAPMLRCDRGGQMNRFVLARGGGQRIPLTIIGGPEGAGKTTLLRRLFTHNDGRHIAVVLNQVDRVKAPARQMARRWLLQRTVRARVVETEHCCLPAAMILGASLQNAPVHAIHGEWTPTFAIDSESRRCRIVQPRHEQDY